jgi:hypothetical protein
MEDGFLKHVKAYNKVTVYILPLLKLNKFSFGENNFVGSYINRERSHLCVEIKDLAPVILHGTVVNHTDLVDIRPMGLRANYELWFAIPRGWGRDIDMFVQGKYSRLSEEAKSMIRTYSGFPYRLPDPDGMIYSDYFLLAMEKHKMLREKWEARLDERIPTHMELMNPPSDRDFREFTQ